MVIIVWNTFETNYEQRTTNSFGMIFLETLNRPSPTKRNIMKSIWALLSHENSNKSRSGIELYIIFMLKLLIFT